MGKGKAESSAIIYFRRGSGTRPNFVRYSLQLRSGLIKGKLLQLPAQIFRCFNLTVPAG